MRRITLRATIFAASLGVAGCEQPARPETLHDCILQHIGGATSDGAANLIRQACRDKFPGTGAGSTETQLTDAELAKLDLRLEFSRHFYSGKAYNGNTDVTVSSITIAVTEGSGETVTSREYRQRVNIRPLSVQDLGIAVLVEDDDADRSWKLTAATGYREAGAAMP